MPTRKFSVRDIKGLTPAVDPTVGETTYALGGRNYTFDSRGPKSAFGNEFLSQVALRDPTFVQGFRIKSGPVDRTFTATFDGLWEWDNSLRGFKLIYPVQTLTGYRWTHGYLNNYFYFAHPSVGILALHRETGVCLPHSRLGIGTPEGVRAICIDNGRLIAVSDEFMYWSESSNGLSFQPSLGGGGFQKISDRVPGSPVMVSSYGRGCFTWTSGGVMRSEFTADAAVYRHRALNTDYRLVNSFCSVRVDGDGAIVLDERGLFQTQGEAPVPFSPVFNEFLRDYIDKNKLHSGINLRLEWDEFKRLLFVMVSTSYANPKFEKTFVLFTPTEKWGSFDSETYGILPFTLEYPDRIDSAHGFVDSAGLFRVWNEAGSVAVLEVANNTLLRLTHKSKNTIVSSDEVSGWVVNSTLAMESAPTPFNPIAGYYEVGGVLPVTMPVGGLDSRLQIGLLRAPEIQSADDMSELVGVLVRSAQTETQATPLTDLNLNPAGNPPNDLNLGSGAIDFGLNPVNYINHGLRVIGTLDGLSEFAAETPPLAGFLTGARYYACSVPGVWHTIEVSATEPGDYFHVKTLELTAAPAGRLL